MNTQSPTETPNTAEHKGGAFEALQKNAVTLSGAAGVVGYSALMMEGLMRGDKTLALTGIAALSPIILAVFGNGDKTAPIERMTSQMRDYMIAEGFDIPEEGFAKEEAKGLGVIYQLMKEHPVELSYATMFLGTTFLWAAGLKEFQDEGKFTKLLTATTTLIGSAIVATIPEKSPLAKEDNTDKGFFGNAYEFVQKNTLPIFAGLNLVDVGCWTKEMLDDSFAKPVPWLESIVGKHGRGHKIEELKQGIDTLTQEINKHKEILGGFDNVKDIDGLKEKLGDSAVELLNKLGVKNIPIDQLEASLLSDTANLTERLAATKESLAHWTSPDKLPLVNMTPAQASGALKAVVAVGLSTQILLNFVAHKNKTPEEMLAEYDKAFVKTAEMLQHIPQEDREVALQQMVSFMSVNGTMKDACMNPLEIKAAIEKEVAKLEKTQSSPAIANNIVPLQRVNSPVSQGKTAEKTQELAIISS
jgi:hypothetical protein